MITGTMCRNGQMMVNKMKQKQRVPKGEMYFYINEGCHVSDWKDTGGSFSAMRLLLGNYFHTKEEAESMARKLRAVLKGADVIEMPSEEEIRKYTDNYTRYPVTSRKAIDWLKSKIVK